MKKLFMIDFIDIDGNCGSYLLVGENGDELLKEELSNSEFMLNMTIHEVWQVDGYKIKIGAKIGERE